MSPPDSQAVAEPSARRGYAMVLMVISSVVVSFGGLVIRSMETTDALQINFYRSLALLVVISSILVVQYRSQTFARVYQVGRPGLIGGVMLAAAGITFLQALTHTTVANTMFILSAIPFMTAGLARLVLKEELQRATLATMVVAVVGVFVMMVEGFEVGSLYGNAMALVTALCFSSFAVVVRRHRGIDMLPTLLVSGTVITVFTLIARFDDLAISTHDLVLCLFYGGVLSGIANWLFIAASRHLVAAEVTLFMLLEFALGPLWVWLFVSEVPTSMTIAGGALVMAAVALRAGIELGRGRQPPTRGRLSGPT